MANVVLDRTWLEAKQRGPLKLQQKQGNSTQETCLQVMRSFIFQQDKFFRMSNLQ